MLNHKLLGSVSSLPSDDNFENVALLLSGDGTNGAQNNTFLDSSSNNFTITRNGNTTQGSFSPYGNLWSNYFNQSSFLASSATGVSNFGTGNYTFECWVNPSSFSSTNGVYDGRPAANGAYFTNLIDTSGKFFIVANNSTIYTCTTALQANTWSHIAVVRGGTGSNQSAVFINGVRDGTFTDSTNYIDNRQVIGATAYSPYGVNPFLGYISNMRFVKGTDVYGYSNTSFTVPTTPLTAISGTSLLTCQSNRFIDNSTNNIALSVVNSGLSVQRFSPFNPTAPYDTATIGGSGYFNGSGDNLTLASNSAFAWGTGAYTAEFWVYLPVFNGSNDRLWDAGAASGSFGIQINNSGSASITRYGFVDPLTTSTNVVILNAWNHIAVVRNGTGTNQTVIYVNGVARATGTDSNNWTVTTNPSINGSGIGQIRGYVCDFRLVKGSAVYTSAFTPPTAPVTAITNTQLLCNFTNADIADLAMQNNLETVGNAQVSTSVKKYGTGSLAFDGSGDYLRTPANNFILPFSGDFTVECWVNFNSTSSDQTVLGQWESPTFWEFYYLANKQLRFYYSYSAFISVGALSTGTWYHIAAVRNGSTITVYLNGVSQGTATYSTSIGSASKAFGVGSESPWNSLFFNGYIDDLRITKVARYTANFTPPTSALPTY